MNVDYSRPLRLGEGAANEPAGDLERRLAGTSVAVSVDSELEAAALTARVLLSTLRRLPGALILQTTSLGESVIAEIGSAVAAVDPSQPLELVDAGGHADIRIHVGSKPHRDAIRIVPDGHGAHLADDPTVGIEPTRPASALGSIFAAALAAGEVFKHAASVTHSRRRLQHYLRFCPVSLSDDLSRAVDLPPGTELHLALLGLGAIGTATTLILSELDATGELTLVDRERFAPENVGTYSLGGATAARDQPWKVDVAAAALSRYTIHKFIGSVEDLPAAIDKGELPWPRTVLTGLDSIAARHAAQRIWPNRLIDAGTGDTMIGIHEVAISAPCLMCFFPTRFGGPGAAQQLANITGLPVERAARGDDPLTEADLVGLGEENSERLRPHIGKPVCGLVDALGLTTVGSDGYRAAIPFAAQQAACLAVGAVIGDLADVRRPNFAQFDALIGPQTATIEQRSPLPSCYCQERPEAIRRTRAARAVC
jgi:hypothetical protein